MTAMIIATAFLLVGALMTYRTILEDGYIPVTGRALSSEIRKFTIQQTGTTTSSTTWRLFVSYEYQVGDQRFTSDTVAASPPNSNAALGQGPSKHLEELASRYEAGREIVVFVSPDTPSRSVLIKASWAGLWLAAAGGILLILSFIAFRRCMKTQHHKKI